jgi:hypothetical protein
MRCQGHETCVAMFLEPRCRRLWRLAASAKMVRLVAWRPVLPSHAGVAQLVEQLIRNQQVLGSSPSAGSSRFKQLQPALPLFSRQLQLNYGYSVLIGSRCELS